MTVDLAWEDEIVRELEETPVLVHYFLPPEEYRKDGRILVTRDGLRVFLHRQLYRRLVGPITDSDFLVRNHWCQEIQCVNPDHYHVTRRSYVPRDRCRNGHLYTSADERPDGTRLCRACYRAREERKKRGGDPHWRIESRRKFCPYGHAYTDDNTYTYTSPRGWVKRKCRTCTIARAKGLDPADVATL